MHKSKKTENLRKSRKNEPVLLLLCFLASALIGYFLTHYVALFTA